MTTGMNSTRPDFHTITPYLIAQNGEGLVDFVKKAFGAVETYRATGSAGGQHVEVKIGSSMLMIGGGGSSEPFPAALFLYVEDVDKVFQQALEAGATSEGAPENQSYGDRMGTVKDSFGNTWFLATHLGE
jgi:PhnB protein